MWHGRSSFPFRGKWKKTTMSSNDSEGYLICSRLCTHWSTDRVTCAACRIYRVIVSHTPCGRLIHPPQSASTHRVFSISMLRDCSAARLMKYHAWTLMNHFWNVTYIKHTEEFALLQYKPVLCNAQLKQHDTGKGGLLWLLAHLPDQTIEAD